MKSKYYDSIDNCPILVFILISQGKKALDALCFEGNPDKKEASNAWDFIYAEYIEAFGVSAEYIHYMRERLQLCNMIKSFFVDGEIWQKMLIEIKKNEIKQLEASMTSNVQDFHVILGRLSKSMGFGIDPNKTSIRQFYSYLKAL